MTRKKIRLTGDIDGEADSPHRIFAKFISPAHGELRRRMNKTIADYEKSGVKLYKRKMFEEGFFARMSTLILGWIVYAMSSSKCNI